MREQNERKGSGLLRREQGKETIMWSHAETPEEEENISTYTERQYMRREGQDVGVLAGTQIELCWLVYLRKRQQVVRLSILLEQTVVKSS